MEFLELNDDCLIQICRYLDAEAIATVAQTCTTLMNIATNNFRFKKSYTCYVASKENEATAARTLRKIGKHFTKLDLMFESDYLGSLTKLFTLLTETVDKSKLIELSILGELCRLPLEILAPILSQLEVLTLQNVCWEASCSMAIDLPKNCENLRKLFVNGQVVFAPNYDKSFSRLECLDVDFSPQQANARIFMRNPQLKQLYIRNRLTLNMIQLNTFNTLLPNLETLHIDVTLIPKPVEDLPGLRNLGKLRTLELHSIPTALFGGILKVLETLNHLTSIVLQCVMTRVDSQFTSAQESLVCIPTKLEQLESFVTVNIDWMPDSVTEFIRNARGLIYFDFWSGSDSNYKLTPAFIREVAAIRRFGGNLQPLKLKMYAMDDDLKRVS